MIGDIYEVYVCKHNDEIVYIGSGKTGRHKHCLSGVSANYELNKLHFTELDNCEVNVIKNFKSKLDSMEYEKTLIKLHNPKFNTVHTNKTEQDFASICRNKKYEFIKMLCQNDGCGKAKNKVTALAEEFFKLFKVSDIISGDIMIYSKTQYEKCGNNIMTQFARNLRCVERYDTNVGGCKIFNTVFINVFGYDLRDKCVSIPNLRS